MRKRWTLYRNRRRGLSWPGRRLMFLALTLVAVGLVPGPSPVLGGCESGDCLNGRGVMTLPDGRRYEGEFRDGRRFGRGTMAFPEGDVYTGQWRRDLPNGYGELVFRDGNEYRGNFRDGLRHGLGTLVTVEGNTYVGEWRNDVPSGNGTLKYNDGRRFIGFFVNGQRHGRGTIMYPDGRTYAGKWENGNRLELGLVAGARAGAGGEPVRAGAEEQQYCRVRVVEARLRAGPGLDEALVGSAARGMPLRILAREEEWLRVEDFEGEKGWIHSGLVAAEAAAVIRVNLANLRQGPGLEYAVVEQLPYGRSVGYLKSSNEWLLVSVNEKRAWIHRDLVWPPEIQARKGSGDGE